jgi:hypothetical protein
MNCIPANTFFINEAFKANVNADFVLKSRKPMTLEHKIAEDFTAACTGRTHATVKPGVQTGPMSVHKTNDAHGAFRALQCEAASGCNRKHAPTKPNQVPAKPNQVPAKPNQAPAKPNQAPTKPNTISDSVSSGLKRRQVPKKIKEDAWFKYVGRGKPDVLCICCRNSVITPFQFHAGHITSCKNGGATIVENIRPICGACNLSMGAENMRAFVLTYYPSNIAKFDAACYDSVIVSVQLIHSPKLTKPACYDSNDEFQRQQQADFFKFK